MSVISLDIQTRQSLAEGAEFGEVGGYEQLDGEAYFAVDPGDVPTPPSPTWIWRKRTTRDW